MKTIRSFCRCNIWKREKKRMIQKCRCAFTLPDWWWIIYPTRNRNPNNRELAPPNWTADLLITMQGFSESFFEVSAKQKVTINHSKTVSKMQMSWLLSVVRFEGGTLKKISKYKTWINEIYVKVSSIISWKSTPPRFVIENDMLCSESTVIDFRLWPLHQDMSTLEDGKCSSSELLQPVERCFFLYCKNKITVY